MSSSFRFPILPRWSKLSNSDSNGNSAVDSSECYACTQVGVPVFHSTSCDDGAHQLEWQAFAGSSLVPISARPAKKFGSYKRSLSSLQPIPVLDPRSRQVQIWNQIIVLARGITLAVDPLFFYALVLSIGEGGAPCLSVHRALAVAVTVFRTFLDVMHLWHVWLQFRLAYVSKESLVFGCGRLVWDARDIALNYVKSLRGFWLDVFVILPIPQAVFWLLVRKLIREEKIKLALAILLLTFLFQFLPKVYHSFSLAKRMQKVTGYIFGTVWWGFGLNIIAYLVASHVIGGCWYVLATQRMVLCLKQQCEGQGSCDLSASCSKDVCYQFMYPEEKLGNQCGANSSMIDKPLCLDKEGPFDYGIFSQAILVVSSNSIIFKILAPIQWGLLNLSSFGNNLSPTSNSIEVIFSIFIVLCGLTLFTLLVGNIQVFLDVVTANKERMQLSRQDIEWWMSRRQLPVSLRRRVRHFERQRWAITGGEDEQAWMEELPEGLRRDIKRYLCLHLIKKVPLFRNMDDLILDNICDRVKTLLFSKDEKIIREGDPVTRMVFIMRGRVKHSQSLSKGMVSTSVLVTGGFIGDELLSWCLRRPFMDRLPASYATFICEKPTVTFSLDAQDLKYITDHFRYRFANNSLKWTLRYNSSNWRTWAAVNIQLAWRQHRVRTQGLMTPAMVNGSIDNRLLRYAAVFMSVRPHDHIE